MTTLVIGASGLIGSHVAREFGRTGAVAGTYHGRAIEGLTPLDVAGQDAVLRLARTVRPSAVCYAAALRDVELCEREPERTRAVNVEGVRSALNAAREAGATFIYFSSDYVFDGEGAPYAEDAEPRPVNEYGRQKAECESLIRQAGDDHLIARVSTVYGWPALGQGADNVATRVLRALRAGEPLDVPVQQIGTPAYAPNLAEALRELMERGCRGTYHLVGNDRMNRYEFSLLLAGVFGLDRSLIVPRATATGPGATKRPLDVGLLNDRARASLCSVRLLGAREGVAAMRAAECWRDE